MSIGKKVGFSLVGLVLALVLAELTIRAVFLITNTAAPGSLRLEQKTGWRTVADVQHVRDYPVYGKVRYSTSRDGFRVFGDTGSPRPRIFVIGDSQTQALKVSDGETYYDLIGRQTNSEVFAYGGGGYGSLQEYMILDEYLDEIQPDLVLWQFCDNDIHNNSYALESSSWKSSNRMLRPYLEDGTVVYRFPHRSWLYRNFLRHSYLVQFFNIRLGLLLAGNRGAIDQSTLDPENPDFKKAVKTTGEIMKMVRRRTGDTAVAAFSACGGNNYRHLGMDQIFATLSRKAGIHYIAGVPTLIQSAKDQGLQVTGEPLDRHWNARGHRIVGQYLLEQLREMDLIGATE